MANVQDVREGNKKITVELGGRVREIAFDMNAFAELELRYGSIDVAMKALQEHKLKDVKIILWAAIIHEEITDFDEDTGEPTGYNITPYDVGKMVKPAMIPEIMPKLMEAMGFSMPDMTDPEQVDQMLNTPGLPEELKQQLMLIKDDLLAAAANPEEVTQDNRQEEVKNVLAASPKN